MCLLEATWAFLDVHVFLHFNFGSKQESFCIRVLLHWYRVPFKSSRCGTYHLNSISNTFLNYKLWNVPLDLSRFDLMCIVLEVKMMGRYHWWDHIEWIINHRNYFLLSVQYWAWVVLRKQICYLHIKIIVHHRFTSWQTAIKWNFYWVCWM